MNEQNLVSTFTEDGKTRYSEVLDNPAYLLLPECLEKSIDHLDVDIEPDRAFSFIDLGTADGMNCVKLLPKLRDLVSKKFGGDREVVVTLTDIEGNDFKEVWKNILSSECIPGFYFATIARSFYKQCLPSNSVHLAMSSCGTHWLGKSCLKLSDSIFPNKTKEHAAEMDNLTGQEWETFLLHRAKELVKGGVLLCVNLGINKEGKSIWEKATIEPVTKAWNQLFEEKRISSTERDALALPFYFRTEEEHCRPFVQPQNKTGLKLLHFEHRSMTTFESLKLKYGQINSTENKDGSNILEIMAEKRTALFRCVIYHPLYAALDQSRPEKEKGEILDQFYRNFKSVFEEDEYWLCFPPNIHFHIMIMKKM